MVFQMQANDEQCFPVALITMMNKAVLSFEFVNESLKGDQSNEGDRGVLC